MMSNFYFNVFFILLVVVLVIFFKLYSKLILFLKKKYKSNWTGKRKPKTLIFSKSVEIEQGVRAVSKVEEIVQNNVSPTEEENLSSFDDNDHNDEFYRNETREYFLGPTLRNEYPLVYFYDKPYKSVTLTKSPDGISKGFCEPMFLKALQDVYEDSLMLGYAFEVPNSKLGRVYTPDFMLVESDARVIIEIDEKYSGEKRTPTHYINSYDEDRNAYLTSIGWTVIRFAEEQVFFHLNSCIEFLQEVVDYLNGAVHYACSEIVIPTNYPRWTYEEAIEYEKRKYREEFLKIEFRDKVPEIQDEGKAKVIEFDAATTRQEVPHGNDSNVEFVPRIPEGFSNSSRNLRVRRTDKSSNSHSIFGVKEPIYETHAPSETTVTELVLRVLNEGNFLFFSYENTYGFVKPIKIFEVNNQFWLEGTELINWDTKYFKIDSINLGEVKVILRTEYEKISSSNHLSEDQTLAFAIANNLICSFSYTGKSGYRSNWKVSNLSYSDYNGCIDCYALSAEEMRTFRIDRITFLRILPLTNWPRNYQVFGLNKPPADPTRGIPAQVNSSKTTDSESSGQGCLLIIGAFISVLSGLLIILFII